MNENTSFLEFLFDKLVNRIEMLCDIFWLDVIKCIDNVINVALWWIFYVVHEGSCCDDYVRQILPVFILFFCRVSTSTAADISPKWREFPWIGCLKISSDGWYSTSESKKLFIIRNRKLWRHFLTISTNNQNLRTLKLENKENKWMNPRIGK